MTQKALDQVATRSATLLVVEDDPDIRSALQQLFTNEGYIALAVASGEAALKHLSRERVDLVVLDLMLPDMDGYQICEQVRSGDSADTPIVMLTALTQQYNVTEGLRAGADDYVKKPFAPEELILRIRRLLYQHDELHVVQQEAARLRDALALVERQLQTAQNETEIEARLRREFLHNVTTHMQALNGIIEAASRKAATGTGREIIQQIKSRVRSATLVYEISEALQEDPVEVGGLIRTIASALKTVYRPWRRVMLQVDGATLTLPLTIASSLAMIVNELVTNCFKHAFPENRFGRIDISYAVEDDLFRLAVADDGVGFDVEQSSPGRGRITVASLIHSLGGSIDWHSSPAGTSVQIAIPLG